jgi:hypothetical protein
MINNDIENKLQFEVTKKQLAKLEKVKCDLLKQKPKEDPFFPISQATIHKAQLEGVQSLIDELEDEIEAYNDK